MNLEQLNEFGKPVGSPEDFTSLKKAIRDTYDALRKQGIGVEQARRAVAEFIRKEAKQMGGGK